MPHKHPASRETVEAQARMFALFVGPGLHTTRTQLARDTWIPDATLQGWATGTVMPVWAVNVLAAHLPPEAVNLLFGPDRMLVMPDSVASNWDLLAVGVSGMTLEICEARSDGRIDHVERERLKSRGRALVAQIQSMIGEG